MNCLSISYVIYAEACAQFIIQFNNIKKYREWDMPNVATIPCVDISYITFLVFNEICILFHIIRAQP